VWGKKPDDSCGWSEQSNLGWEYDSMITFSNDRRKGTEEQTVKSSRDRRSRRRRWRSIPQDEGIMDGAILMEGSLGNRVSVKCL